MNAPLAFAESARAAEAAVPVVLANVSRRGFVQGLCAFGGLVLAAGMPALGQAPAGPPKYGADRMPNGWVDDPLVFVAIAPDGTVSIVCHRAEMGQGVRTGMPMIVADELEADWSRVRVLQADGDEKRFGNQDTDGSRSTRHFFEPMRRCGAAARTMLEMAAAARWSVPLAEVLAREHEVIHLPTRRRLGYGELAQDAAALPVPPRDQVRLKDPARFRYIGRGRLRPVDAPDIVAGKALYGIDVRLPGMLHAVVARPPIYGGKVRQVDDSGALAVPGVLKVVHLEPSAPPALFHPVGGVAVVARNTWAATEGRKALRIEWDDGPNAAYDSAAFRRSLEQAAAQPGKVVRQEGDVDAALAGAARRLAADYYVPHLAHASMEPPAATARLSGGKCEIWGGIQSPQRARDVVARRLNLQPADVTVHVTLLGGGFGRKSKPDYAVEAALVSQAMGGQPVKLTWTREDDLRHGYFHTVAAQHLEAGLGRDGAPIAWLHRTAAPSIASTFNAEAVHQAPFELGMGMVNVPLAIPNVRIENPPARAHARIGWFRSVANIHHAFAVQSFIAELAAAAGRDPKAYLLEVIGPDRRITAMQMSDPANYGESPDVYALDTARLRQVIEIAAREAGWGRRLRKGHGLGIAAHYSFLTYVAAVIEVSVDPREGLTIPRVDIAVDCGPCINPDRVRAQMEGAAVMGVGVALRDEITFAGGRVQQGNFDTYPLTRMSEAPRQVRVHIVPVAFGQPLGGVGEPGVPPIAPALCNAIFAATGKRIRSLPVREQWKA